MTSFSSGSKKKVGSEIPFSVMQCGTQGPTFVRFNKNVLPPPAPPPNSAVKRKGCSRRHGGASVTERRVGWVYIPQSILCLFALPSSCGSFRPLRDFLCLRPKASERWLRAACGALTRASRHSFGIYGALAREADPSDRCVPQNAAPFVWVRTALGLFRSLALKEHIDTFICKHPFRF